MILDLLSNRGRHGPLPPRIEAAFDFLETFDPATPYGRYAIDGDAVFALVQGYETGPSSEKRFETHRRHVDVQYVVSGVERILYAPADGLAVEIPYDAERDVAFFGDPAASTSLLLPAGAFAVFHTGDAHKPGCMAGGRHTVTKVVVKVRV